MRLSAVVEISQAVAGTAGRLAEIAVLADLLGRVPPDEVRIVISFLSGEPRQGRMKIGGAVLSSVRGVTASPAPRLELRAVDAIFDRLAALSGPGSSAARAELLRGTRLIAATDAEQDFLRRLLFRRTASGCARGCVDRRRRPSRGIAPARIRRAVMLAGDLAPVARAALTEGEAGLAPFSLRPFQPVQPMLADSAADTVEALDTLGEAALEYKLDGARIQVHKADDDVRVFSRSLRDVTIAVPEIVEPVLRLPCAGRWSSTARRSSCVLTAVRIPFQVTMRRFGRKLDVERLRRTLPITPMFFDALYLDGPPLLDEPLAVA